MKKILIFSTAYFPFVGGAEVAVKELTDRVSDFEFDMITARMDRKLPGFEQVGKINVYRVGLGWKVLDKFILPFAGYLKAKELNKKNGYDLIWSIMASQASVAAVFLKITRPKIKLLLTLQEGDEEAHLKRYVLGSDFLYKILIRPWHLLVFKKADFVTTISNYLKERAKKNGVKCPIEIVPNGTDLEIFSPPESISSDIKIKEREKLGINEGEKVIITVSRLVKKNAVDDLIRAGQYLDFPFKILIIGDGPDKDKLESLVAELNLNKKVIFEGYKEHSKLRIYYRMADVFVRPSLSEGLGNVFLEAMAAGVPIIGTPVGGIPDFLKDGETGLFCKVRNPASIAEKINLLFSDENLRQRLIIQGKKLVEENYDWDTIAEKMRNVFNKL